MRNVSILPRSPVLPSLTGWVAIAAFALLTAACLVAGVGASFRWVYIVGAVGVGGLLYWQYPLLYVGFVWWLWFLTPFVTRVIDYQSSFDEMRLMQVAPFLVTLLTVQTFVKDMPRSLRQGGLPFVLAVAGVIYGTLIGLLQTSPVSVARGLLDWFTPLMWGFYLFNHWQRYLEHRQTIQKVFLWGVVGLGGYGICQYLVAPEWDKYWLISTKLTSMGIPEPLGIRVWSTMASPAPFAMMMMTGLLILFSDRGLLRIPAAAVGYLSFLLSLVRTAWGGWIVAMLVFSATLSSKLQLRLLIMVMAIALCIIPLTTIEPFAGTINARLQTVVNLSTDYSARQRQEIYQEGASEALSKVLGNGVGNTFVISKEGVLSQVVIDSGILDFFFTLGWFGGTFYLGGLLLLLYELFQSFGINDPFLSVARAVSIGCLVTLPYGSGMLGATGMILWGFMGIGLAAQRYHDQS